MVTKMVSYSIPMLVPGLCALYPTLMFPPPPPAVIVSYALRSHLLIVPALVNKPPHFAPFASSPSASTSFASFAFALKNPSIL